MKQKPQLETLSAVQRERLAYIEFRLWFLGEVSRADVIKRFGVASAAATRDLVLYQALAPLNVAYLRKKHCYMAPFEPLFQHQVERVLSALTSGFGDGERMGDAPLIAHDVPTRPNQPALAALATVTRAIHMACPLSLLYYSMKTGAGMREIVPLALVDSGQRWHVRAYDRTKHEFRDLVLTRMDQIHALNEGDPGRTLQAGERIEADQQWQQWVELDLIPHPAHLHPASIEHDYAMSGGCLRMRVRAAVAGYVLRQWQVDCSVDASLPGAAYRLRLKNLDVLALIDNAVLAPGYVMSALTTIMSHGVRPYEAA